MTHDGRDMDGLPKPSLDRLRPVAATDLLAAWIDARPHGQCSRQELEDALSEIFIVLEVCSEAENLGLIEERADGFLAKSSAEASAKRKSARRDVLRDFAVMALGGPSGPADGSRSGKRELSPLALRQLFGLDDLPPWPTAQQARCALLVRILSSVGRGIFKEFAAKPSGAFKFDEMSRSIYLAFAGLERGSVVQADASLLSSALGGPADTVKSLTATVLRAAIAGRAMASAPVQTEDGLEGFALSVRRLAGRLETKPFAGRVAIAQVYDAGLAQGLAFGTLDRFKERVAEAAREGLLDLERYDIAGPFDASLKERSRLRLGRDERHFIVNQWI